MLHLPGFRASLLTTTDGGDGGAGAGGGAATPKPADTDQGAQRIAALEAENAAFRKANAERAKADEDAKRAADEKLKADGKLQELLAQREKELAELRGDADLGRGYRERETARIAERMKTLSAEDQALVTAQPSLDMKAQLIDRLAKHAADPGKKEPAKAGAAGVPVGNAPDVDVDALLKDGWRADQIKEKHPEAYAKHAQGFLGTGHLTSYARQMAAKAATSQKNGRG